MEFSLFMKKWGDSWQKEIDSKFAIVPPSVEQYEQSVKGGAEAPPVASESAVAAPGGTTAADISGPSATYNYLDTVFVSYPSDTFAIDEGAILDTIAAKDGSVKISIIVQISHEDHDTSMEFYDSYSTYEQYTTKDLTVAGYDARMITYRDSWGDYCAEVHVNFGKEIANCYGVNFSISSETSMDAVTSSDVMAIINTLKVEG